MRIKITTALLFLISALSAKEFYGTDANLLVAGAVKVVTDDRLQTISFAEFKRDFTTRLTHENLLKQTVLQCDASVSFELINTYADQIGWIHYRYKQKVNNVVVPICWFCIFSLAIRRAIIVAFRYIFLTYRTSIFNFTFHF